MIKVYGCSDDLIEIDGDIYEEFNYYGDHWQYLGFSDGTVLKIRYDDDGIWRIVPVMEGEAHVSVWQCPTHSVDDKYSDLAELTGTIRWVMMGTDLAT